MGSGAPIGVQGFVMGLDVLSGVEDVPIGVWGSTVGLDVPIGDLSCAIGAIGMGAPNGAEDVPYWGLLG